MKFSLDGALEAKRIINECFKQARTSFHNSLEQGNANRQLFWIDRLMHLAEEVAWINEIVFNLEAEVEYSAHQFNKTTMKTP